MDAKANPGVSGVGFKFVLLMSPDASKILLGNRFNGRHLNFDGVRRVNLHDCDLQFIFGSIYETHLTLSMGISEF